MSLGLAIILTLMLLLGGVARSRGADCFESGLIRSAEQILTLLPRMLCALIGASFAVQLIPTEFIGAYLGEDAGVIAIVIGSVTGMLIPAGPVVAFSIAAVFANEGASAPALVAFITSWSVFALHRVFIFEVPLLGLSFLRLRLSSVVALPFLAGGLVLGCARVLEMLETVYTFR